MRSKAWLAARVPLRQARMPRPARARRSRRLRATLAAAPVLFTHAAATVAMLTHFNTITDNYCNLLQLPPSESFSKRVSFESRYGTNWPFAFWHSALIQLPSASKDLHTHTDKHTYMHTYIHTYIHTNIHTYIHTYIHKCMHAHVHATHTYIQTYIHCIHTRE